jgi:hypothetical protein
VSPLSGAERVGVMEIPKSRAMRVRGVVGESGTRFRNTTVLVSVVVLRFTDPNWKTKGVKEARCKYRLEKG